MKSDKTTAQIKTKKSSDSNSSKPKKISRSKNTATDSNNTSEKKVAGSYQIWDSIKDKKLNIFGRDKLVSECFTPLLGETESLYLKSIIDNAISGLEEVVPKNVEVKQASLGYIVLSKKASYV